MTVVDDRYQTERLIWSSGNYAAVAQLLVEPALTLVERANITAGMDVLDVATGTGNVAIPAARKGAVVVGLDLTPQLLDKARARSEAAGVQIDWREGDAQQLPFPDDSFDCVLSTFGVQFAPNHRRTAQELFRVCRPGGLIGVCSWTPQGTAGQYIHLLTERLGGRRHAGHSPTNWGDEEKVRELFPTGVDLTFERDHAIAGWESLEAGVAFLENNYGCAITARHKLEPQGTWPALRTDIITLFAAANHATDGTLLHADEYLRFLARKH